MLGGSGRAGEGAQPTAPLCYSTGAKRSAPSGPSASSARSAVTATMGASVRPPQEPVSVSLATRARAARSDCAPRVCTAQAAPCPAPVTPRTLSGGPGQGQGGLWWKGVSRATAPTSTWPSRWARARRPQPSASKTVLIKRGKPRPHGQRQHQNPAASVYRNRLLHFKLGPVPHTQQHGEGLVTAGP